MIRLFISSTFSDMQNEREWIHQEVYPELREYGMKIGIPVDICDLRWGIHIDKEIDEQEAIRKIMEVCLWEVSNCDPYIVAMIGERHGTCPDKKTQERIAEIWKQQSGEKKPLPSSDVWDKWSLTQWELEYSFLTAANPDVRALCLFRKGVLNEVENSNKVFMSLKERIRTKAKGDPRCVLINDYAKDNKEDFISILKNSVKQFIDEKAKTITAENPAEAAFAEADAYTEEKSKRFFGREKAVNAFNSFLSDRTRSILGYYGPSGMGKSALMAHLYQELSIRPKYGKVRSYFIPCGASEYSNDYLNVLKQLIYGMEKNLDENAAFRKEIYSIEVAEEALRSVYRECIKRIGDDAEPLVFFLDALDKISGTTKNRIIEIFQERQSTAVLLICSQICPYDLNDKKNIQVFEVAPLDHEEIKGIMIGHLFSGYHSSEEKSLRDNPAVLAAVEKKNASLPLYLDIMISALKMRMKEIQDTAQRDLILTNWIRKMPESTEELCWQTMEEAILRYLKMDEDGESRIQQSVNLLTITRQGLREIEIEHITGSDNWKTRDFSTLRRYLNNYFRQLSNGAWVFEHDIIKRSMLLHLMQNKKELEDTRKQLYSYLINENCRDIELIAREGLFLSVWYKDADNGLKMLRKTGTFGDYAYQNAVRTITAIALDEILQEEEGRLWFERLINTDARSVMMSITGLLELDGSDDYERQYPAKTIADFFWDKTNLFTEESLSEYVGMGNAGENGETTLLDTSAFDHAIILADLCTEYCNICESIGKHWKATQYLRFALKFWLQTLTVYQDRFDDEKDKRTLARIAKHINALFFTNNKNLNATRYESNTGKQLEEEQAISKDVLSVIDGKTVRGESSDIRALYDSNTGQYYNALGITQEALKYHFKSLQEKADILFSVEINLGHNNEEPRIFGKEWISEFRDLCSSGWENIDGEAHREFWGRAEKHINDQLNDEIRKLLREKWKVIGVSYRTILQDYANADNEKSDYLKGISIACDYAKTAIALLDNKSLMGTIREPLITRIRYAQVLGKIKEEELEYAVYISLDQTTCHGRLDHPSRTIRSLVTDT